MKHHPFGHGLRSYCFDSGFGPYLFDGSCRVNFELFGLPFILSLDSDSAVQSKHHGGALTPMALLVLLRSLRALHKHLPLSTANI